MLINRLWKFEATRSSSSWGVGHTLSTQRAYNSVRKCNSKISKSLLIICELLKQIRPVVGEELDTQEFWPTYRRTDKHERRYISPINISNTNYQYKTMKSNPDLEFCYLDRDMLRNYEVETSWIAYTCQKLLQHLWQNTSAMSPTAFLSTTKSLKPNHGLLDRDNQMPINEWNSSPSWQG